MDQIQDEETFMKNNAMFNPFSCVLEFLASYGWFLVGGAALVLYTVHALRPRLDRWREAKEDAEYHKDPDRALARMEAVQRARERQQRLMEQASARALEEQKEREERKRAENLARLEKYGAGGGQRLGADDDYLPLSGAPGGSSYRAPKRSACRGGGCGR